MAKLGLNKSGLSREKRQLASFQRFLPSLDMKRQQLMAQREAARRELRDRQAALAGTLSDLGEGIPMLSNRDVAVEGLIRIKAVHVGEENAMGTRLPVLAGIEFDRDDYGLLVKPHWVDAVLDRLEDALRQRIELTIAERRIALLDQAVRKITQRVNLFDKVLIPQSRENIRKISVFLADEERAAVVRAKFAKAKHAGTGSA